jgi:hypothetical protein
VAAFDAARGVALADAAVDGAPGGLGLAPARPGARLYAAVAALETDPPGALDEANRHGGPPPAPPTGRPNELEQHHFVRYAAGARGSTGWSRTPSASASSSASCLHLGRRGRRAKPPLSAEERPLPR